MEDLKRFDIAVFGDVLMVVVESDLLPPDPAVVVIPLLRDYPAVSRLNPVICIGEEKLILATRLIASVRRARLQRIGSAVDCGDEITRAVDVLMGGV
ncbi:CcdB-like protein [Sulfitobacter noctilucae]|uniref:CcdB family protein n=1 Tax=Sulfitobacter noctilucae TaxID=1342302 RepID=UPI0004684602|nr:CcdB family protein [Sulfitobacter noctilucae]KIN70604.1 CcdB-like protein [Sulfitobacter noctilucae]